MRKQIRSLTKSWHFLSTSSKLSMIEVAFHHKLLIYIQPIFSFLRKVSIKVGFITSNRLRVLVLHDIPPNQELVLKKQLQELQKKWNIVSPEKFEKMISGIEPIQDNNLLQNIKFSVRIKISWNQKLISIKDIMKLVHHIITNGKKLSLLDILNIEKNGKIMQKI